MSRAASRLERGTSDPTRCRDRLLTGGDRARDPHPVGIRRAQRDQQTRIAAISSTLTPPWSSSPGSVSPPGESVPPYASFPTLPRHARIGSCGRRGRRSPGRGLGITRVGVPGRGEAHGASTPAKRSPRAPSIARDTLTDHRHEEDRTMTEPTDLHLHDSRDSLYESGEESRGVAGTRRERMRRQLRARTRTQTAARNADRTCQTTSPTTQSSVGPRPGPATAGRRRRRGPAGRQLGRSPRRRDPQTVLAFSWPGYWSCSESPPTTAPARHGGWTVPHPRCSTATT
jgi:hypothetical protein